ncbi:hypothetical protein CLF_101693 [Clonorchis sinensis]|uniref:Uncharacterized protein n=1 Tax=Clonorchis sinensis TaxID=79923 RepID=G7Y6C4_CLOSI|nr:hypothetical protein CLF_101693 [Clonorchis sinensis]
MSIEFNQLRELLQQQQKQFEEAQLKLIEPLTQRLHIQTAATSTGIRKMRTPRLAIEKLVDPEVKRNYQNQLLEYLPKSTASDITGHWEKISKALLKDGTSVCVGCCFGQKAYPTQDWPGIRDACRSGIKPRSDWSKIWTQQPIMTQYWPIAGCRWCIQNASEFPESYYRLRYIYEALYKCT